MIAADESTADVTGTVLDASGAVIPGATVTLRQSAPRTIRTTVSNAAGRFALAALPVGSYRVEISSPGFFTLFANFSVKA